MNALHRYTSTAVVIDGPAFAYRYYYSWVALSALKGSATDPKAHAATCSKALLDTAHRFNYAKASVADARVTVCFDQGDGGRRAYFPQYKAARDTKSRGPEVQVFFQAIREEALRRCALLLPQPHMANLNAEADDMLATLAVFCKTMAMPVVLMTHDFDLLPYADPAKRCYFYDAKTQRVLDQAAIVDRAGVPPHQILDYKALVGDVSDGVPGAAKIGRVTAQKLLQEYGSLAKILKVAPEMAQQKKGALKWKSIVASLDDIALSKRLVTPVDCANAIVPTFRSYLEASPAELSACL